MLTATNFRHIFAVWHRSHPLGGESKGQLVGKVVASAAPFGPPRQVPAPADLMARFRQLVREEVMATVPGVPKGHWQPEVLVDPQQVLLSFDAVLAQLAAPMVGPAVPPIPDSLANRSRRKDRFRWIVLSEQMFPPQRASPKLVLKFELFFYFVNIADISSPHSPRTTSASNAYQTISVFRAG